MSRSPQIGLLPDGRRLHLQDGPIDLIIQAFGAQAEIRAAYRAAALRFDGLLDELCAELPALRARASRAGRGSPAGRVAQRMAAAVAPFAAETFITPMAAVAGAVAEEILDALCRDARLDRASVNNGGDIALHLGPEAQVRIGMVDRPDRPSLFGHVVLSGRDPVRGIATSGWRGRSFSLGIADAVTVLANRAAEADAAATIIANAVDLPDHAGIERVEARQLQPDSDLGRRRVTRGVPALGEADAEQALAAGAERARALLHRGLIHGAAIHLQGRTRIVGDLPGLGASIERMPAYA